MAAGSGNSSAGILTQLSEDPLINRTTKLSIPFVFLFHLPQLVRYQQIKHGMEKAAVPQL